MISCRKYLDGNGNHVKSKSRRAGNAGGFLFARCRRIIIIYFFSVRSYKFIILPLRRRRPFWLFSLSLSSHSLCRRECRVIIVGIHTESTVARRNSVGPTGNRPGSSRRLHRGDDQLYATAAAVAQVNTCCRASSDACARPPVPFVLTELRVLR